MQREHPLICLSVFLIKLSVQIKSVSGWFVGDKVTGQRPLERFLFLLIVKQKLQSWPPRDASVKNNLTERLPHCKALKNIITKHKRNLLHDFKGYNWIHQYQKKNITRAASAAFSFIWHTTSQNKQMDIFDTRNVLWVTGISWHSGWTTCGLLGKGLGDWYRPFNLNIFGFLCLTKLFPNCGQAGGGNLNIQTTLNDYFILSASVQNNFIMTRLVSVLLKCPFKMKSSLQKWRKKMFSSYPINSYVGKRSEGGRMCPWKHI